ncbi:hypothetical protein HRI_001490300 [Hibiscus trionum]|uniref:Uncharacterized protein n=1 Tax=Hibiscus trionum TaxID=183268 RepID=A0A9W7HI76_HIBTR|nr:hypothetical protein HRI_001490300 [Hibiscus trionum]
MENQIKQSRKQNWFQKQFSRGNSEDSRPKQGSHEAAVAAAAFAIQSVEEAKTKKLKKENGRNGISLTNQFSLKRTSSAVENSKEKAMKQKTKEFGRVHSSAKPSSGSAAIVPIAAGDYAEWYEKLKFVVCGSDRMPKTYD